jgi:hypothetical protein
MPTPNRMPDSRDAPDAGRPAAAARTRRLAARRRVLWVAGALLVLLVAAAAWATRGTRYDTQALTQLPVVPTQGAPAWSRPCWRPNRAPYHGLYTLPCARVAGRVVYRQSRDPDGDGDAHLLVLARSHLVNLKFRHASGDPSLPGVGRRVVAVGLLSSGRLHVPEVDVRRLG